MPLFDRYLIVDWSASNAATQGRDSIWIADCDRARVPVLHNPRTRFQAMALIDEVLEQSLAKGKRIFVGFDFGFGYPGGAAKKIGATSNWRQVWQRIHDLVDDNPDNKSNRFDVAAQLNRVSFATEDGPFWGCPNHQVSKFEGLSPKRPQYSSHVPEKRIVETVVKSAQPVWKLAYTGSVGSQTLLGIACLEGLRERFLEDISIWPFETKFDEDLTRPICVAEVYPSLFPVSQRIGEVKDAAQVRCTASRFAMYDANDGLRDILAQPADLTEDQVETVLQEEGWIVGAGVHPRPWSDNFQYVKDPSEIYRHSFALVEHEAGIDQLPKHVQDVATRLVHSCGMIDIVDDLAFSGNAISAGKQALMAGKPIYVDVEMVKSGIIRRLLPANNSIICMLNDPRVPDRAKEIGNTRSAAAVDYWSDMEDAIVVIGNAPTALYRVLEAVHAGAARPALIVGIPVGFVGAEESKETLATNPLNLEYITVRGRRGGSAMASAVLNALAGGRG